MVSHKCLDAAMQIIDSSGGAIIATLERMAAVLDSNPEVCGLFVRRPVGCTQLVRLASSTENDVKGDKNLSMLI